jgi:drug/metabolite transporter (DMT)-like permease
VNYSVLKRAFEEVPPAPFNALRLVLASTVFLTAILIVSRRSEALPASLLPVLRTPHAVSGADWRRLAWLGLVGHSLFQWSFITGLARTTASNAALIYGTTPVAVALMSVALGRERIGALHWAGAALSVLGVYLVVGQGAAIAGATVRGDVLIAAAVCCMAVYTIGGGPLMSRHSPLFVTGVAMAIGTVPYVAFAAPAVYAVPWGEVSATAWGLMIFAALGPLCFSDFIWYVSVQRLGASHTSIYSNAIPLVAMFVAWLWLGEPITGAKLAGATAVVGGVLLTRWSRNRVS